MTTSLGEAARIRLEGAWETLDRFALLAEPVRRALSAARWRDEVGAVQAKLDELTALCERYPRALTRAQAFVARDDPEATLVQGLCDRCEAAHDELAGAVRSRLRRPMRALGDSLRALTEAMRTQAVAGTAAWEPGWEEEVLVDGRGGGDLFERLTAPSRFLLTTRRLLFQTDFGDGQIDFAFEPFAVSHGASKVLVHTALDTIALRPRQPAVVATHLAIRRLMLRSPELREAERAGPPSAEPRIVVPAHSPGPGVAVVCAAWAAYLPLDGAQAALDELTDVAHLDPLTAVKHLERLPSPHFDRIVRRLAAKGGSVIEHDAGELRTEQSVCIVSSIGGSVEVEQMRFDTNLTDEWRRRVFAAWV